MGKYDNGIYDSLLQHIQDQWEVVDGVLERKSQEGQFLLHLYHTRNGVFHLIRSVSNIYSRSRLILGIFAKYCPQVVHPVNLITFCLAANTYVLFYMIVEC